MKNKLESKTIPLETVISSEARNPIVESDFGKEFLWGSATSAYQIEGAWNREGKGLSIWDSFSHKKRKIKNGDTGDIACNHYNHYKEDVNIISDMSLQAYRFSLSWPRILPTGLASPVNAKGVDFYNRLIDSLLEKSIRPFVTLYHWDLPQSLQDKGGWQNRDIVNWFSDYAEFCVKKFGDRVKDWIVLNEPMIFLSLGYLLGIHAPGLRGVKRFLEASHYTMLAQAEAARKMRDLASDFQIGTTVSCTAGYPYSPSKKNVRAAQKYNLLINRLYVDPVVGRGYPTKDFPFLKKIYRYFKDGDAEKIKFSFDFFGINTYTRKIIKHNYFIPYVHLRELRVKKEAPKTAMGWEIYPRGIYDVLKQFSHYPEIPAFYITENGAAFHDQLDDNGLVADPERIKYFQEYLAYVLRAKKEGMNIKGYFAWSLLDNFEWAEGYHARFGLVHVDFATGKRTVKESAKWYSNFIRS